MVALDKKIRNGYHAAGGKWVGNGQNYTVKSVEFCGLESDNILSEHAVIKIDIFITVIRLPTLNYRITRVADDGIGAIGLGQTVVYHEFHGLLWP